MPFYPLSPIGRNVQQASPGLPTYLLGSFNRLVAPTRMQISTVALAGTTATVVGTVIEGQIPTVGQLVSISGAVPAYFNVTNAKILSVSAAASPDLGVYTITFTLTNAGIPTTASPGLAVAPQIELGDTLAINNGSTATANAAASVAVAIQENVNPANAKSIRADVTFPTVPGACVVQLQTADLDIDSEYVTLGTVASVVGGAVTGQSAVFTGIEALFCRFLITGLATSGSVIGKVTV